MPEKYLKKILTSHVYDVAHETPLEHAPLLSKRTGNTVFLKREDEQPVFSFKIRGAYNKMAGLPHEVLKRGVICASAGNHAQGVALAARQMKAKAIVVMPRTTPEIKINAVRGYGARVILHGDNYDAAWEHAKDICQQKKMTFIHPFDDPDVIAGQGTIGFEILKQHPQELEAVFVPVGGGGLISGIGAYIKALRPRIKVVGVEAEDCDAMEKSLVAGRRIVLDHVNTFVDGTAVRQVGKETFRLAKEVIDEVVVVSNDEVCAAIKDIFEDRRSILEPAGALAMAGLKAWVAKHKVKNRNLVVIASGANVNFDRLRHVAERAEVGERREAVLSVTIPEKPGSFKKFCATIGSRGITEFNYRYDDPAKAHIFVGVQIHDRKEEKQLMAALRKHGYKPVDMTDNEMAKLHIRHMVGGHATNAINEIVYRFMFPERPGALMNFLNTMGGRWNISLFHYRNHGADFGRVLVGMQVPAGEKKEFGEFLDRLGYDYTEETGNPAYKLFLG